MNDAPPRLKIAYIVDSFGRRFGGAEAYGVALMRELSRHHDVTVVARRYDQADLSLPWEPVRVAQAWPSWLRVAGFAYRARRQTQGRFDIVHSHVNGRCGDVEVIHVTPVRYNWRVRPLPWLKRLLSYISPRVQTYLCLEARRLAPRPGHRVVAVSPLTRDQLRQAYGDTQDYPVIPPGVDLPVPAADVRQAMRARLHCTPDDQVLLLMARDPWRKGLPTALRALAHLPETFKLLVVGIDAQGESRLRATAEYQALADRIRLVRETPEVAPYYQAADQCIHPTLNDSFGMAPLEAMAHGLPVIISPAPYCGFAEYLTPRQDALIMEHPEDAAGLARHALDLRDTPELRQTLCRHAAALVQRHSWPRIASDYLALYRALLREKARTTSARP